MTAPTEHRTQLKRALHRELARAYPRQKYLVALTIALTGPKNSWVNRGR